MNKFREKIVKNGKIHLKEYEIIERYSNENHRIVFRIRKEKDYVVRARIYYENQEYYCNTFHDEIAFMNRLYENNIGPKIITCGFYEKIGYVIYEHLEITVFEYGDDFLVRDSNPKYGKIA